MHKEGITIHELSKMADVTVRTIRFYTDEGVMDEPAGRDRYARYTRRHYLQLAAAKTLKGMFLPLRVIRDRLASLSDAELESIAGPLPAEIEARFAEIDTVAVEQYAPMMALHETRSIHNAIAAFDAIPMPRMSPRQPQEDATPLSPARYEPQRMAIAQSAYPATTSDVWHRIVISPTMELHVREDALQDEAGEIRRILASMRKRK